MKHIIHYIFFLLILIPASLISAGNDDIIVSDLPFLDRLPSREIITMHQDSDGFIWIGTADGVARYDGYETVIVKSDHNNNDLLYSNHIVSIDENPEYIFIGTKNGLNLIDRKTLQIHNSPFPEFENADIKAIRSDRNGHLWISVYNNIYRCDTEKWEISNIEIENKNGHTAVTLYEDSAGNIWALFWGKGMLRYSEEYNRFIALPKIGVQNNPFKIFEDNKGRYWILTWGDGLFRFYPDSEDDNKFIHQPVSGLYESEANSILFDVVQDSHNGYLWMLTYNRLIAVDINDGKADIVKCEETDDYNRMFSMIMKDREGNLWLGAYDSGINIFFNNRGIKRHTLNDLKAEAGAEVNISCMNKDDEGIIWLNQERLGVRFYDENRRETFISGSGRVKNLEVNFITPAREKNTMWISSSFIPVIFRAERSGSEMILRDSLDLRHYGIRDRVKEMKTDEEGNLWILSGHDLLIMPYGSKDIIRTDSLKSVNSFTSYNGKEIFCITGEGFCTVGLTGDKPEYIWNANFWVKATEKLNCITVDGEVHYASTSYGRIINQTLYDCESEHLTSLLNSEGSRILRLHSNEGSLIVIKPNSISIKKGDSDAVSRVNCDDISVPVSFFKENASFIDKEGNLYAGGHRGFISIGKDRYAETETCHSSKTVISDFRINGKSIFFGKGDIAAEVPSTKKVITDHNDRNIEICFSGLSFAETGDITFRYMMEGADNDWITCEKGRNSAYYNRLGKGTYRFRVKSFAENNPDAVSETQITIIRKAAWYESDMAICLYLILIILIAILAIRYIILRDRRRTELKMREELTKTKIEYFTNISHELLTPLAIISCVSDNLDSGEETDKNLLVTLKENITRLNNLIRQALEFRKSDAGKLVLKPGYHNISDILETLLNTNFTTIAKEKNITLNIDVEKNICGYLDKEKLEIIVFNLMSNAIKYSYENGDITATVKSTDKNDSLNLIISVKDNGPGINKENHENIFSRFYINAGSSAAKSNGIGLSITKEMAELHNGDISVISETGKGAEFIVSLPIDGILNNENTELTVNYVTDIDPQKPTIFIIDDNRTLLDLMARTLSPIYNVLTCDNGLKSAEILSENNIDLILCDMMMPEISGIDLCRKLKSEIETSHIPVIMLTARNDEEARTESYKAGADGFIAKPFDSKVLFARIDNLMTSFRQRHERFRSAKEPVTPEREDYGAEHIFIKRLIEIIESSLEDSDFDLEFIAAELNVSKSTMNRKIKAVTGMTPMDFVRNIRLKFACRLLKEGNKNISEIAYAVGFGNPKYFSTCFKEEFGVTPSEFAKSEKEILTQNT